MNEGPTRTTNAMSTEPDEIKRREQAARQAIKKAFGTEEDEFGATMFVSHHLEEIDSSYWQKHLATETPEPAKVLDLLVLQSHWGDGDELDTVDDGIDTFDFTLPEEVTNYVISVRFDDDGEVEEISMES
jgi:hypothetical protein